MRLCQAARFKRGVIYDTATVPNSGHGQLIVGYDDKIGQVGQRGAFLVQNSFGTSWPPRLRLGRAARPGLLVLQQFRTTQVMAAVAYPVADGLGSKRLQTSVVNAADRAVSRSYQWTPATTTRAST